ncbi:CHAT domain-containing protein [Aromatoleum toluolicum]|uniref:CHAT domain-containing protein n=1 Tax=Aromatoleum toluolicum TaxID=90060 RepID=A0ABX1NNF7_9RHOO|nr:CHAT domain-containing protein [Aromatoleum toluolicum]NMG00676.1 CHAT domain-containing protein [Aromatoleum toluolicum]
MRPAWALIVCVLLGGFSLPAGAQFFAVCDTGSKAELEANIRAHEEHIGRLENKLVTGWYWQGKRSKDFHPVTLVDVHSRLAETAPRRTAVLFHAYNEARRRLCAWLIVGPGTVLSAVTPLAGTQGILDLRPAVMEALGVAERSLPVRSAAMSKAEFDAQMARLEEELAAVSRDRPAAPSLPAVAAALLPPVLAEALEANAIDTVVVVPVFDLGVIPFAALPIGKGRMLIDAASIIVAPGFFVFREKPLTAPRDFSGALVVGNPQRTDADWHLAPLPGAEAEAKEVARMAQVEPLIGDRASRAKVLARLRTSPPPPLLYFATHGIADEVNPLDGGFLVLSDGRWTGKQIAKQVPRGGQRPLVVLSACQTGLGKTFDVGTIGLARAWQQAGAANVVMSLWLVGDRATQELMTRFMALARQLPPDKALREAMLERRSAEPRPMAWASFAVFGGPLK